MPYGQESVATVVEVGVTDPGSANTFLELADEKFCKEEFLLPVLSECPSNLSFTWA